MSAYASVIEIIVALVAVVIPAAVMSVIIIVPVIMISVVVVPVGWTPWMPVSRVITPVP